MKECFGCKITKPLSEYYKHKSMSDGHLNKCKECIKAGVKERRATNPAVQEYDRKRGNRQNGGYLKEWREKYPKKYKAHTWINNALRDGRIEKREDCEQCGSLFAVEGHHDDYDKPTVVRWLCALCHKRWHSEHGEALNPF